MKLKKKKYYPYYIGTFILCVSILIVLIDNEQLPFTSKQKNIIVSLFGVVAAIVTFLTFIGKYNRKVKKQISLLLQSFNLEDNELTRNFENIHLLPAKKLLIDKVNKSCEEILDNHFL